MSLVLSMTRRWAAFAVAVHLAALPTVAAVHEAGHYRFEAGVALGHDVEPCPDGGGPGHEAHWDAYRPDLGDLLCAFYQIFQQGLKKQAESRVEAPKTNALPVLFPEARSLLSLSTPLPQSRSPPRFA